MNDRWTLRPSTGSNPTTTRISHTPGERSRIEPVPRFVRVEVIAASLYVVVISTA